MREYVRTFDVEAYRRGMRARLPRYDINHPFKAPLVPIPELGTWRERMWQQYAVETNSKENTA